MNTEFIIDANDIKAKIYMQIGFFEHTDLNYPLHKHIFAEIHVFLGGTAVMQYNKESISLFEGDVLFIPAHVQHRYQVFDTNSKRVSFFIDCDSLSCKTQRITLPKEFMPLFCKEIQEYTLSGKDSKLKALLSYICSDFITIETVKSTAPITNRELIIEDFFSKKYNLGVTLNDLAEELAISSKQTEREVKRLTGNTFAKELAKRKLNAAIILSQTTNLSLAQISQLVGYSSYCGFYKAYKKMFNHSPRETQ